MNLTKFSTQKTTVQCYKSSCQAQLALRQMAKEAAAETKIGKEAALGVFITTSLISRTLESW